MSSVCKRLQRNAIERRTYSSLDAISQAHQAWGRWRVIACRPPTGSKLWRMYRFQGKQAVPALMLPAIVGGCAFLGIVVFGGYAVLFSTASMIDLYAILRRWIEDVLSAVFAVAGLELLALQS